MQKPVLQVLLVEDDEDDLRLTRDLLGEISTFNCQTHCATTYSAALSALAETAFDVSLIDYRLGAQTGLDLLRQAVSLGVRAPMILLTGQENHQIDLEAMKAGAADYLLKGKIEPVLLERTIRYALERKRSEEALQNSRDYLDKIINEVADPIFVTNRQHQLTLINDAMCRFSQRTREQLIGLSIRDFFPADLVAPIWEQDETIFTTGEECVSEEQITDLHGNRRFAITRKRLHIDKEGEKFIVGVINDITERRRAELELERLALVARKTQNAVIMTNPAGYIEWVNEGFYRLTGYTLSEVKGKKPGHVLQGRETNPQTVQKMRQAIATVSNFEGEIFNYRKDGRGYWLSISLTPICDEADVHQGFIAIEMDITERKRAEEILFQKEQQLLQAQKLEAVGQLAAGIAHEINTPTQYVGDNIRFLEESFEGMTRLLQIQEQLIEAYQTNSADETLKAQVKSTAKEIDVEFLTEETPRAIRQSLDGIERVAKIVGSMKEFAHPGSAEKRDADIHRAIETTVTVASNEWKYVAEIECDFDPTLRSVPVVLREFNQVILNIIVNAAHAIGDTVKNNGQQRKGSIKITTKHAGEWAEIRIADTGGGIPVSARAKIFDPFFTTKEIGKGTGQGLAISRSVIVDKHQGAIEFETEEGKGTTFIIRLPLTSQTAPLATVF